MLDLFDGLLDDVHFMPTVAEKSATIQANKFETIAANIKAKSCYLPLDELADQFTINCWLEVALMYRLKLDSDVVDNCIKSLINSGVIHCDPAKNEIILASGLNGNITQQLRNEFSKVLIPITILDPATVAENRYSLASKPRRKSAFIRAKSGDHASIGLEGMDQMMASVRRLVRVHIQPSGYHHDPVIAELFYTLLPDQKRHNLGVIKISKKRLYFACDEWKHLDPSLRLSLLNELGQWGLVPNDAIKDSNLPFRGMTKFSNREFQSRLNVTLESSGNNPTMPYTLVSDERAKRPIECNPIRQSRTRDIQKFVSVGKQHDRELKRLRSRAITSENALTRARRDNEHLNREREALLLGTQKPAIKVKATTGRVINLVGKL
jgi:hypothetical protein